MAEECSETMIEVRKLNSSGEAEICARMMEDSEPWITLHRDYQAALKILTDPVREVYVALNNLEITGFIVINMLGAFIGYIQTVCIAPSWRNKKIGSQLIAFAERRIFSETPNVFLCVSSFNKDAQRLYEKLGYHVIGELKDYIVNGHSEILLRKSISPLMGFKKK